MEEKLQRLYNECINELKSINIDINNPMIGEIDVRIAPRNTKRYGCCKQEEPDLTSRYTVKRGRHKIIGYERFNKHHIEINKWVMDLEDKLIKNTIMHEIIHCFPRCNNHGETFKKYASYINQNLNYNITRVGDKKEDFKKSNLDFDENENNYKYKIVCQECGQLILRKRLQRNFIKKYRCGKCGGKLELES